MRLPQFTFGKVLLGTAVVLVLATGTTYAAATIGSGDIVNGSIRSIDIKNGAVAGVDIKNETIKSGDIRANAVTSSEILDATVQSADILNDTIVSEDVADGALTSADILNGTLTSADIADNSLTEADLGPGSVTTSELGTITRRSATSANIPPGGNGNVTANCNAGEKVLTGGNDGFNDVYVVASRDDGNGWRVFAHNDSAGNRTITAHAYCLAP